MPRSVAPAGPPGFIDWLRTDPRMRRVYMGLRDRAPHLLRDGAAGMGCLADPDPGYVMRGLGQDAQAMREAMFTPTDGSTDSAIQPLPFDPNTISDSPSPFGTVGARPSADPSLPGGQSGGWADTIAKVSVPLISTYEQIQLFNTQLKLAQAGKPLLKTSQMQLPGVGVHVTTDTGTKLLVAGGIAAVLGLLFSSGRRRA